jgi:ABC-type transport system substrate-binding protein
VRPASVLGLALALAVAADAALGPRYGGEIVVGVLDLPQALEPGVPRSAGERAALGLVHETLVGIDPQGLLHPSLAEGWTSAAEGLEWTLRLHPGAAFHDGRAVTADDVGRSLRRLLRSRSAAAARLATSLEGGPAYRAGVSEELPGLAASGDKQVVLRLAFESALPLVPLASPAAAITSLSGAGAGPFVPASAPVARRLDATAFAAHVRGRPFLDRLQLLALSDAAAAGAEMQARRLDAAPGDGPPASLAATLLLVLSDAQPLEQVASRRALAEVVSTSDLVRTLVPGGDPTPALVAPQLLPPLASPPAAAPRPRLAGSVSLAVSRELPPLLSQRLVALLRAAGLDCRVTVVEPPEVMAAPATARLLVWTPEVAEAGLALEELASLVPVIQPVKEALEAAARETDPDRRRVFLLEAEEALRRDARLVPLGTVPVAYTARRGLHGLRVDAAGRLVLEDAWLEP